MRAILLGAVLMSSGWSTQLLACPWHGANMRYSALFREMGPERHWLEWSDSAPDAVEDGIDRTDRQSVPVPVSSASSAATSDEDSAIRR
jgi:hypothetical protein